MTNLLMAVATILVTNTTEELGGYNYISGPCPEGRIGCAVMHGIPSGPPTKKIVSTTVSRVTNVVHATLPNPIEIGRCPLVCVRQEFDWVTKAEWQPKPATTNTDFSTPQQASVYSLTNSYGTAGIIVGTNLSLLVP